MSIEIPDSLKNPLCDDVTGDVSGFTIDVPNSVFPLSVTSISKDGSSVGSAGTVNDIYGLAEWLNDATDERWDAIGVPIGGMRVRIFSTHTYASFTNGGGLRIVAKDV